jgi:cellulose synthase operon protein C
MVVLRLGLLWCVSTAALGQAAVSPTSPMAEDTPDVGDVPGAPVVEAPRTTTAPGVLWEGSTDVQRITALIDAVTEYELELRDVRDAVRSLAERKYKQRRARIEDNAEGQITPVVAQERVERNQAIEVFEAFLRRHPSNPEFSPDAIFRLAELYFERVDDEHQVAMKDYKTRYDAWKAAGSNGEQPAEPGKRFDRSVALYQRLLTDFPSYKLGDAVYYLLGYTLRAQGDSEPGLNVWMELVERFPKSRFFQEVWFRIGDQHFDDEKWDLASAAFQKVVDVKQGDFYDKALYKLAWTYYLVNRFDDSVAHFVQLLDYSAQKKLEDKDSQGSVLEEEAIQYVAVSFGDDNWKRPAQYRKLISGKSLEDPTADIETDYVGFAKSVFERAGKKPYERDVFAKLGDNLFKQSRNLQAIAALEHALALDPLHEDAPKLQDQVVQAYVRERAFDKAAAARALLVQTYAPDSPWAKKWGNNSIALKGASDLARANLYSASLYYHQQATQFFADNKKEAGVQYFKLASDSYTEYLRRYPHDKNAYELSYYLAETYYYSLRFDDAVKQYEVVRDSTAGTKYRADSALNAVYSYEEILKAAMASGTLPTKEIAVGNRDAAGPREEIPALRVSYINAIDRFLTQGPEHEMAPAFGFRAGEVYYSYGQFDEAVRRFQIVVDKFPTSEAAKFAANLILDDLLARKDWQKAAEYAGKFKDLNVGGGDNAAFAKIQGGARFNIAKETLERGDEYMQAGRISEGITMLETGSEQYLALLAEDPKREFADVMMYNAALSLEKARRPVRAADLYERLYKEYPDSGYAPEAMFRVANKSEQAFQFDKAVTTYLGVVNKYPKSERRADAQVNAALALEGQQRYQDAAREFERFATLFPERPEAADVFFRAAIVHRKQKSFSEELASLKRFIARYGGDGKQAAKVAEAHVRIADIELEQAKGDPKRKKAARDQYQAALALHERTGKSSPAVAFHAAKAAFQLAEEDYQAYARMGVVSRDGKGQIKELEAKSARLTKVEETYKRIIKEYKAAEWSLASLYRIGSLYDNMQQVVLKSPCPDDIKKQFGDVGCDEYSNLIEDRAFALETKAVDAYVLAKTNAAEFRVQNEWTKKTLEALNLLRPQDHPIDKPALVLPVPATQPAGGMQLEDGGAPLLKDLGPGPAQAQAGGAS